MARRVLLVILLTSLLLSSVQAANAYESPAEATFVLEEIMNRLNQYHLEKPGVDELVNGAIEGMLQTVGDPYTEYFSAEELNNFANSLDGDLFGIGVELRPGAHYPTVIKVIPFSPAEKAGIQAGDIVTSVDDLDLKDMKLSTVVEKIRGPQDSKVKIKVNRPGKGKMDFTVVRAKISLPTVDYSLLKKQTGYIYVSSFGSETVLEFENALDELFSQGIKSLILDLRNNGGGYLQTAVDMASAFLPSGSTVVSIEDKEGNKDEYFTSGSPKIKGIPVVIIVNENSASAAEVLAGALKDHGRAKLVGVQTYGKGILQTVIPLVDGGALKVTTHRYYTPAGKSLDIVGLTPDREVIVRQLQLAVAWQELNAQDYQLEFKMDEGIAHVNGIEVECPYMPVLDSDYMFLPLRYTLEALGYRVQFLDERIKITGNGDTLEIYPGSNKARLNNMEKNFERPVLVRQGISYIPSRALTLLHLDVRKGSDSVQVRFLRPGQARQ